MKTVLEAKQVAKSYSQGSSEIEVLKGLNLVVETGETVAILGRSGSGKSTLLSLLAGLDHPTKGEILINETALSQLSEASSTRFRGENLGIIFQQFHLMASLTALENVSLPLEIMKDPQAKQKAKLALSQVGLSERIHHLPHQLSGGESQRVAIARAFVVEPKLLLADEPSGNLDQATGVQVMDLLFSAVEKRNMTLILVTHDTQLAKRCSKRYRLESGQLIQDL